MNRLVALAVVAGIFVVASSLWIGRSPSPPQILLVSPEDRSDAQLRETIAGFRAAGYYVTEHADAALRASRNEEATVLMTTGRTFNAVPETTWNELYGQGVVIGGINVSRSELLIQEPASQSLRYTPDRAIFSFVYRSGDCGNGSTSDWLDNWDLPGIIGLRLAQTTCARR